MMNKRLRKLWDELKHKRLHMEHFLTEVALGGVLRMHIDTIPKAKAVPSIRGSVRGIRYLLVEFKYPVSVIAGENGSGKSTVLFAAACAYKGPGAGGREFVPPALFPDYQPKQGTRGDKEVEAAFLYKYSTPDGPSASVWRRSEKDSEDSSGDPRGRGRPERQVHLMTPGNLASPSELRDGLEMSRMEFAPPESPFTASQVQFAERVLPFSYSEVVNLSGGDKTNLLVATQKNGAAYSELHMATGERAILRLSKEIAQAKNALVLIDEVEAGLHPSAQQSLMLELQQLALRNDLQIIVTTHSPVILNSVPEIGRIFLERNEQGEILVRPPYRDLIQDAFYGRLDEKLNLLCEDKMAESLLQGVFDIITLRLDARRESIRIGGDTGAEEFPVHAKAFERLGQLQNFIFVLDGDKRKTGLEQKIQKNTKQEARVVFLPSEDAPEVWVWKQLKDFSDQWAKKLDIAPEELSRKIRRLDSAYDSATGSPSQIAKDKLRALSEVVDRPDTEICRIVARRKARHKEKDIQPLVEALEAAFQEWRSET